VVAVLGSARDGRRLQAAADGARVAARSNPTKPKPGARVEVLDTGGTPAGFKKAFRRLRALKAVGVVALPAGDQHRLYWKAARGLRVPWITLSGVAPDEVRSPGNLLYWGPTPTSQAIRAADSLLAPLAARRVAVVHEMTQYGRLLAAGCTRNLSAEITLAGVEAWDEGSGEAALRALGALEAEWIYVAMNGEPLLAFVRCLAGSNWRPRLLFADGARDESLLSVAGSSLEGCVFLDGPDPEMQGQLGERLLDALERSERPLDVVTGRAYEAARLLLDAAARAGSTKPRALWEALDPETPHSGTFGRLRFEPHGALRHFPTTWWIVKKGRYVSWPEGLLPTEGCGPPIGFGHPRPAPLSPKGKLGVLTYGAGAKRTIEADLRAMGLSTGGRQPKLDTIVRQEILGRALRIANQLFRREADGTAIGGWSWGLTLTMQPPPEEIKASRIWRAVVAGDHPAAGGQAFGTWVAVYSTFLERTMYARRKLDPPLSGEDRVLLDGSYRWGSDRALNFRADKIRCLMDGFSSAVGLTLSHEYGHLCGCGHDQESPTSIMNVVAGAGASWEDALWIPRHQHNLTATLGIEGLPK